MCEKVRGELQAATYLARGGGPFAIGKNEDSTKRGTEEEDGEGEALSPPWTQWALRSASNLSFLYLFLSANKSVYLHIFIQIPFVFLASKRMLTTSGLGKELVLFPS